MARGRPVGSGDEQRERILAAVAPLIVKHGAPKVRLRDVAAEAGVSVGMIQHYFATRDRLIDEAFRHYSLSVVQELAAAPRPGDDPWQRLVALCKAATSSARIRQRSIIWFDFAGQAARDASRRRLVQQVYEAWVEAFVAVVEDGTSTGVFKPVVAPRMAAAQLVALVDGIDLAVAIRMPQADRAWREQHLLSAARALLGVS
ncbi:TetR/AcrR family transcriptional regulator [Pseudonocardia nigra]|uniref:TetR/AcrR family transcriptional regulator n=1 Tax=Pseudonocardia nigra TaxID=1921578 RepID=UPI001C5F1C6D|nr:TetR family transcriptional regulator C-terminal domain-containing protein [Pseudonocardia nigra]